MSKEFTQRAIDALFKIKEGIEKADKLNKLQKELGFENDFFSFSAFLDINERVTLDLLDWYFYDLLKTCHPAEDIGGGLATYTIYDAGAMEIDGEEFNLKDKDEFTRCVELLLRKK